MIEWNGAPEVISLDQIAMDELLQVRNKVDQATVRKYAEQMGAGVEFPPLKVARIEGSLFLVDGWHRVSATRKIGASETLALVVEMTREAAIWEAARANLTHGLPLKTSERRAVFQAYVRAGENKQGRKLKPYRDIAKDLGGIAQYTTIRGWMEKDFKRIFTSMGDKGGHKNPNAGPPKLDLEAEFQRQADEALDNALNFANLLKNPHSRHEIIAKAEQVLKAMKILPHEEPDF
jgi:hypothetical protein